MKIVGPAIRNSKLCVNMVHPVSDATPGPAESRARRARPCQTVIIGPEFDSNEVSMAGRWVRGGQPGGPGPPPASAERSGPSVPGPETGEEDLPRPVTAILMERDVVGLRVVESLQD